MSDSKSPSEITDHRDRSIRLAVFTSLISKSGTTVLRLVSIPIAISQLSLELFGVYTTITMAVSLVDMLHIGIGPALTRELPKALAAGDREKEKTIFVTSIILSTALTLLAILVTSIVILNVPITTLFGPEFLSVSDTMYRAIWVGIAILGLEMICKTFEMARDGYLETRFTNAWGAAGNVVGAITLVSGIWFFPTIEFLLLAVNGSVAFAKLGNTIHLLIQRPYLFPRFSLFRKKLVPSLALNSARFTVTYALAAALECNLMAYLIGRAVGPAAVGVFNIMVTVLFSLTGIVVMFTKPYWPALMDAFERKDIGWIKLTSTRLRLGGLGFALLCGVGLTSLGPWLLPLWVGEEFYSSVTENFQMDRFALGAFSIYFAAFIWRHINQTLALGVGGLNPVVFTVLAEGVFLFCASSIALVNTGKISFIYLAMAGSILLFSSWLFPCIFRRGERSLSTSNAEPSEPDQSPLP